MEGKSFTVIVIDNETGEKLLEEKKATAVVGCVCNKKNVYELLLSHMNIKTVYACLETLKKITNKIKNKVAEQMGGASRVRKIIKKGVSN